MIAFFAMAAALMLVSAYGASCIAWDPTRYQDIVTPMGTVPSPWTYVRVNILLFQVSNIFTWLMGIGFGVVIYMFLTAKRFAYIAGLATSAVGFLFGVIPAVIADTKNFTVPWEGISSPHWGRTLMCLLVLVILIAFYLIPGTRNGIKAFTSKENRIARTVPLQLIYMSFFFFWMALISFGGTEMLRGAHVIDGVNYWEFLNFQILSGYLITAVGSTMLTSGLIIQVYKIRINRKSDVINGIV